MGRSCPSWTCQWKGKFASAFPVLPVQPTRTSSPESLQTKSSTLARGPERFEHIVITSASQLHPFTRAGGPAPHHICRWDTFDSSAWGYPPANSVLHTKTGGVPAAEFDATYYRRTDAT